MVTKKGNLTEIVGIYNTATRIVICEFIATNFADKDSDNSYRHWNYLQSRMNYICRARGLNPYKFEVM